MLALDTVPAGADDPLLSADAVVDVLLGAGLVARREVVGGLVSVESAPRRHHNFIATVQNGASYLIKQGADREKRDNVAHEAQVCRYLNTLPNATLLQRQLPELCLHDATAGYLVSRVPAVGTSLTRHLLSSRGVAAHLLDRLGALLARLHAVQPPRGGLLEDWYPWALHLTCPPVDELADCSRGRIEVMTAIQRFDEFAEAIEQACTDWSPCCIVHTDARLDNVVVVPGPGRSRIFLVDWELAAIGDPAWDVGSVFGELLGLWLSSVPVTHTLPTATVLESVRQPLAGMHPAMSRFWTTYCRIANPVEPEHLLQRAVRFAAVRMVQSAYESMRESARMTTNCVCLLQLSMNALARPREAGAHLLGIRL